MTRPTTPPATPPPPTALVVHGHFYQPPRENPWTDEITREPSAAPAHDWNERILAECYRANAFARLYGPSGNIEALVNNYAQISFNVGPTLARFIERRDPTTQARMHAGDVAQVRRLGVGAGLAQVWAHPILPLCNARDRTTQIAWGMQDFERRFGRRAEGIWLPETAADPATLEALIEAGIQYTILAPEQIAQVRPPGGTWKAVTRDTLDTGRAYRFLHGDGSGRSLSIAIFDGPLSREIAFGVAARDSESFLAAVRSSAERSQAAGKRLVLAASDGELYGHHKKFADLMLAHALTSGAGKAGIHVTNLGAYLRDEPPTWEAELAKGPHGEGTAWSCAHGLGRWVRHCGCAMRPPDQSGWSQAWRTPLREALDDLRDRAAELFEDVGGAWWDDPWAVRDGYGAVLDDPPEVRAQWLAGQRKRGKKSAAGGGKKTGNKSAELDQLLLLELQRSTLLMYASCGWFFDDIAGIESALVIRQAAYVLDLWPRFGGKPPVKEFVARLAEAKSNMRNAGTGADVYHRVARHRTTSTEVAAAVAFAEVARAGSGPGSGGAPRLPGWQIAGTTTKSPRRPQVKGRITARCLRTGEETPVTYEAKMKSPLELVAKAGAGKTLRKLTLDELPDELRDPVAFALVERLAASADPAPADCRRAIALGRLSAGSGEEVDPLFHDLLKTLLRRLLEAERAEAASEEHLSVILELLEALPPGVRQDSQARVQEWIWCGFEKATAGGKSASLVLLALAHKVGIAPGERRPVP